jgi:hypothetical protein
MCFIGIASSPRPVDYTKLKEQSDNTALKEVIACAGIVLQWVDFRVRAENARLSDPFPLTQISARN